MKNQKIFETLEFAKIKKQVKHYVQTERAGVVADAMSPHSDVEVIRTLQSETEQALGILMQQKQIPIGKLKNLEGALKRLEIGASLNGVELAQIGRLLGTTRQLQSFFDQLIQEEKVYPALTHWANQCVALPKLEQLIQNAVAEDGSVLSSASTQLATIRRQQ